MRETRRGLLALLGVVGASGCLRLQEGGGTRTVGPEATDATTRDDPGGGSGGTTSGTDEPYRPETDDPTETEEPSETATPTPPDELVGAWHQFQGDAPNTGRVSASGPTETVQTLWSRTLPGSGSSTPPAIADGFVFFGDWDGYAYAFDGVTGKTVWNREFDRPITHATPVVWNDLVVFAVSERLYGIARETGALQWRFDGADGRFVAGPSLAGDTLYATDFRGGTYAVSAGEGTVRWRYDVEGDVWWSSPAVDGDTAYVTSVTVPGRDDVFYEWLPTIDGHVTDPFSNDGVGVDAIREFDGNSTVHAIDRATGEARWTADVPAFSLVGGPTVVDDTVYVGAFDGTLGALSTADGSIRWTFETGDAVLSSPAHADGTCYLSSTDGNLYAIDAASGDQEWLYPAESDMFTASPVVDDDAVYVGTDDPCTLACVDRTAGTENWTVETTGIAFESPAVAEDVVVATDRKTKGDDPQSRLWAFYGR